jgi:hypothetical protein
LYSNSALWPQRERPSCTLDAVKGLRAFPTLAQIGATDAYNLWYLPIDPSTGHRAGDPVQLSHSDGSYVALVGLSRDGKRLAVFKNHIWSGAVLAKLSKNNELSGEPFQLTHSGSQNFAKWQTDSKGLILSSKGGSSCHRRGGLFGRSVYAGWSVHLVFCDADYECACGVHQTDDYANPVGGGALQPILEISGDLAAAFDCPGKVAPNCVIGRTDKDQLVFYSLDPVAGQGKELARTTIGTAGDWMAWAISPDGKQVAVTGSRQLRETVRIVDCKPKQNTT